MQLTQFTDYALRTLVYISRTPEQFATISEISDYFDISRNHLVKIVHHLATHKVIVTTRGKNGGIRLARAPNEIIIGQVVRITEQNQDVVECFNQEKNTCVITPGCRLQKVFLEAHHAFLAVLDNYTLDDALSGNVDIQILRQYKKEPVKRAQ